MTPLHFKWYKQLKTLTPNFKDGHYRDLVHWAKSKQYNQFVNFSTLSKQKYAFGFSEKFKSIYFMLDGVIPSTMESEATVLCTMGAAYGGHILPYRWDSPHVQNVKTYSTGFVCINTPYINDTLGKIKIEATEYQPAFDLYLIGIDGLRKFYKLFSIGIFHEDFRNYFK